jgi:hypothetical protein
MALTEKIFYQERLRSKSQADTKKEIALLNNKLSTRAILNPLDSNPVLLKRGKEREKPKQKKKSTLKKVIIYFF